MADFWRGRPDHLLDDASVAMLDSVVEGWPAGLRLAVDFGTPVARRQADHCLPWRTATRTPRITSFGRSSPTCRQIGSTACSGLLCSIASAARYVMRCVPRRTIRGLHAGRDFIDWLKSMNLFLVPLDDTGTWYRFHNLFLQLLRQQQRKLLDPQTVACTIWPRRRLVCRGRDGGRCTCLRPAHSFRGTGAQASSSDSESPFSTKKTGHACAAGWSCSHPNFTHKRLRSG